LKAFKIKRQGNRLKKPINLFKIVVSYLGAGCNARHFKKSTMITAIIMAVAIDTTPLKPLPVLLPHPVKSEVKKEKEKQGDKRKSKDISNNKLA